MPTLIRPKAKPKDKPTRTANFWGIRYRCPHRNRSWVISTFCRQRGNAERRLREFADLLEKNLVGMENPFRQQKEELRQQAQRHGVEDALRAFETDLRAGRVRRRGKRKPVRADHASTTLARIRCVVEGCRLATIAKLSAEAVNAFLDQCRTDGTIRSAQTRKHYERGIKAFARWCYTTGRLDRDPLERLEVTSVDESDVVHNRGEFTLQQVSAIMQAAATGPTLSKLTGPQRAMLYAFASCTGFRAREAAAVRKRDFTSDYRFVTLAGEFTKNRKKATQPIPPGLREKLATYAADLPPDAFLWPNGWEERDGRWAPAGWVRGCRAAAFLRADAAKVGIVIGREGKLANGGRVLDFHSLRHTFVSNLERAGVGDGMRQQLSRATRDVLERYTHRELDQLAAEGERLPTPDLSVFG